MISEKKFIENKGNRKYLKDFTKENTFWANSQIV